MAKHVGKKFSWVIENFSSLQSEVRSVPVLIGDYKWHLRANPKGKNVDYLCLSLAVAEIEPTSEDNMHEFLLSLVETLCQSLQELSNEDFVDAHIALTCLKAVNFKVDWLEKKLDQVNEKKKKEHSVVAQLQETEENILKLKQKFSELEAELYQNCSVI